MGSALHRDFKLKNMITHVVLDAQMNLTLSLITMSVPGCIPFFYLSGDMLRYCHKDFSARLDTSLFFFFWRHATILPQRNLFLHDLITRVFLRSLQYRIVVLGFLDAFVYARHKHRQDSENFGNFGDCMKGRIRFMTAITPPYAHAYEATCLARHTPGVPHHNFRLPKPKSKYPYLPNARVISRH